LTAGGEGSVKNKIDASEEAEKSDDDDDDDDGGGDDDDYDPEEEEEDNDDDNIDDLSDLKNVWQSDDEGTENEG
jgi:hypothetical protein